jgi:hypothetical protein
MINKVATALFSIGICVLAVGVLGAIICATPEHFPIAQAKIAAAGGVFLMVACMIGMQGEMLEARAKK